jgi:DinB superfamily
MGALGHAVFGHFDFAWARIRGRMDGLIDDEYLWSPTPGSWSVTAVDDHYEVERAQPPPDPEPLTTIAWLTWHIGSECLDGYTFRYFGERALDLAPRAWFATADEALGALDAQWALFRTRYGALDEEVLAGPLGPTWGPYADATPADAVLHVSDEVIHHGAQVATLRDLYERRGG